MDGSGEREPPPGRPVKTHQEFLLTATGATALPLGNFGESVAERTTWTTAAVEATDGDFGGVSLTISPGAHGEYRLVISRDDSNSGDVVLPDPSVVEGGNTTEAEGAAEVVPEAPETDEMLTRVEAHLSDASRAAEAGEFVRALATCRRAIELAEQAQEATRAASTDRRDDRPDGSDDVDTLSEDATELYAEVEAERDAYHEAVYTLTRGRDTLAAAAQTLETDNPDYEDVLERLDALSALLDHLEGQMSEYDFADVIAERSELRARCERLRERVPERRANEAIPATVPSAPRLTLDYADIEKRYPIGSGGQADVYRARVATDDGTLVVALKEPRTSTPTETGIVARRLDQLDTIREVETVERMLEEAETKVVSRAVERLLEEAETWQKLDDHDHIVGIVDYGSDSQPWIAMEYMDAGHIRDRAGTLPFEQALWTATATTEAVRHAHRRGVAHLDLKPENVLFRSTDGWDVPKVADWGLSKHLLEHSKSIEGLSPQYAAPEQFDDSYGAADDLTDVYQLGAVFYELFTGREPFEGGPARVMHQVMAEEPTPPSELADVPTKLDEILLTAMATEKEDRYESVLYLRDDLRDLSQSL